MSQKELEELKCYACACKYSNKKVCVCQRNSSQFDDWTDRYKKDLELYIRDDSALFNVRRYYFDPDGSYKKEKGMDHSFFCNLVKFLNRREKEMSNHLQRSFEYKFVEGEGIEVSGTVREGKKIQLFYLRSDQFGFSAPVNEKCYPYDLYIVKHENKDEAIEQVIKWISMSRMIGGSFLWPMPFYNKYNLQRGGKISSNRRYYIQDRVDLTLWEIKNWYDKNGENDILERCKEINLENWLGHFRSFPTYVTYFMLDDFVSSDGLYNPINIITGKSDAPVRGQDGKNPEPAITAFMEFDKLEEMLNTLNEKIIKRSIKMQGG